MDSLLAQWQPQRVIDTKRFQTIQFGGIELEASKSWKFYDIEDDATVTASVIPRAVPDRFKTIHEAINNADDGDTLWLGPGLYPEKISIEKNISLVAEEGDVTLRQPDTRESAQSEDDKATPVVWAAPGYGGQVLLSGIRIEGLGRSQRDMVRHNIISGWEDRRGAKEWGLPPPYEMGEEPHFRCKGIEVAEGRLELRRCTVINFGGCGITADGSHAYLDLRNCEVSHNTEGLRVKKAATVEVTRCLFHNHTSCVVHASDKGTALTLMGCVAAENSDALMLALSQGGDVTLSECMLSTSRDMAFFNRSGVLRLDEQTCDVRERSKLTMNSIRAELKAARVKAQQASIPRPWYDISGQLAELMGDTPDAIPAKLPKRQQLSDQRFSVYRSTARSAQ